MLTDRTLTCPRNARRTALAALALSLMAPLRLPASILLGSNATPPNDQIALVTTSGSVSGVTGPNNASAAALDGSGNLFVALPGDDASTVQEFNPALMLLGSFMFVAPSDQSPSASYIVDLGWGISSLWASTFTGMVYQLSTTGNVLGSFDTGVTAPGVTSDGSSIYTTAGLGLLDAAPFLYQRDTSGNIVSTIDTGLNDTLGVGFDASTNSFWIGGIDVLSQVDPQGSILQQFALDGEHTGVEVGTLETAEVPEPTTMLLAGLSILGMALLRRKAR